MNDSRCEMRPVVDVGGLKGSVPPPLHRGMARASCAEGDHHASRHASGHACATVPSSGERAGSLVLRERIDEPISPMEPASTPAAGLPAPLPAVETMLAAEDDIAAFSRAATPVPPDLARLDSMAAELSDFLDAGRTSGQAEITFEFSVPGAGSIEGRIVMGRGHADLELRFMRRSVAEAMRARLPELRQLLDAHSDADLTLFIV